MTSSTLDSELRMTVDDIVKPDRDQRRYRGAELLNGLKLLVVSDCDATMSAAALSISAGTVYPLYFLC